MANDLVYSNVLKKISTVIDEAARSSAEAVAEVGSSHHSKVLTDLVEDKFYAEEGQRAVEQSLDASIGKLVKAVQAPLNYVAQQPQNDKPLSPYEKWQQVRQAQREERRRNAAAAAELAKQQEAELERDKKEAEKLARKAKLIELVLHKEYHSPQTLEDLIESPAGRKPATPIISKKEPEPVAPAPVVSVPLPAVPAFPATLPAEPAVPKVAPEVVAQQVQAPVNIAPPSKSAGTPWWGALAYLFNRGSVAAQQDKNKKGQYAVVVDIPAKQEQSQLIAQVKSAAELREARQIRNKAEITLKNLLGISNALQVMALVSDPHQPKPKTFEDLVQRHAQYHAVLATLRDENTKKILADLFSEKVSPLQTAKPLNVAPATPPRVSWFRSVQQFFSRLAPSWFGKSSTIPVPSKSVEVPKPVQAVTREEMAAIARKEEEFLKILIADEQRVINSYQQAILRNTVGAKAKFGDFIEQAGSIVPANRNLDITTKLGTSLENANLFLPKEKRDLVKTAIDEHWAFEKAGLWQVLAQIAHYKTLDASAQSALFQDELFLRLAAELADIQLGLEKETRLSADFKAFLVAEVQAARDFYFSPEMKQHNPEVVMLAQLRHTLRDGFIAEAEPFSLGYKADQRLTIEQCWEVIEFLTYQEEKFWKNGKNTRAIKDMLHLSKQTGVFDAMSKAPSHTLKIHQLFSGVPDTEIGARYKLDYEVYQSNLWEECLTLVNPTQLERLRNADGLLGRILPTHAANSGGLHRKTGEALIDRLIRLNMSNLSDFEVNQFVFYIKELYKKGMISGAANEAFAKVIIDRIQDRIVGTLDLVDTYDEDALDLLRKVGVDNALAFYEDIEKGKRNPGEVLKNVGRDDVFALINELGGHEAASFVLQLDFVQTPQLHPAAWKDQQAVSNKLKQIAVDKTTYADKMKGLGIQVYSDLTRPSRESSPIQTYCDLWKKLQTEGVIGEWEKRHAAERQTDEWKELPEKEKVIREDKLFSKKLEQLFYRVAAHATPLTETSDKKILGWIRDALIKYLKQNLPSVPVVAATLPSAPVSPKLPPIPGTSAEAVQEHKLEEMSTLGEAAAPLKLNLFETWVKLHTETDEKKFLELFSNPSVVFDFVCLLTHSNIAIRYDAKSLKNNLEQVILRNPNPVEVLADLHKYAPTLAKLITVEERTEENFENNGASFITSFKKKMNAQFSDNEAGIHKFAKFWNRLVKDNRIETMEFLKPLVFQPLAEINKRRMLLNAPTRVSFVERLGGDLSNEDKVENPFSTPRSDLGSSQAATAPSRRFNLQEPSSSKSQSSRRFTPIK